MSIKHFHCFLVFCCTKLFVHEMSVICWLSGTKSTHQYFLNTLNTKGHPDNPEFNGGQHSSLVSWAGP